MAVRLFSTLVWLLATSAMDFNSTASTDKAALLIIDVQYCFLEGGALAVSKAEEVVPIIKELRSKYRERFSLVVMTQDWHCPDHVSFASQHPGHSLYSEIDLQYDNEGSLCSANIATSWYQEGNCSSVAHLVKQTLWPDHCVINTTGAEFSQELGTEDTDFVVRKGYHCQVDSYSAFYDNGGFTQTELDQKLKESDITSVYIAGIATDYCVFFTAKDAKKLGYKSHVILDATRGVAGVTTEGAVVEMKETGISIINSKEVGYYLPPNDTSQDRAALVIVDIQHCFLAGGSLALTSANEVIPVINNFRSKLGHLFDLTVLSQDWHCPDHVLFASQYQNKQPFESVFLSYDAEGNLCDTVDVNSKYAVTCQETFVNISETLWPDHCVKNTASASISEDLTRTDTDVVIQKGEKCMIDSYSAFFDNGGFSQTELHGILQQYGITTLYITGLATDFCVYYTSLDAKKLGYKTYMIQDGSRGVSEEGSTEAIRDMMEKGINVINSTDIEKTLDKGTSGSEKGKPIFIILIINVLFTICTKVYI